MHIEGLRFTTLVVLKAISDLSRAEPPVTAYAIKQLYFKTHRVNATLATVYGEARALTETGIITSKLLSQAGVGRRQLKYALTFKGEVLLKRACKALAELLEEPFEEVNALTPPLAYKTHEQGSKAILTPERIFVGSLRK